MTIVSHLLNIGLVVNPWAGIGGPSAFKGSDDAGIRKDAESAGYQPQALNRARQVTDALVAYDRQIRWYAGAGVLGSQLLTGYSDIVEIPGVTIRDDQAVGMTPQTTAEDTRSVVRQLMEFKLDLLLFVGGDGTARDVLSVVREDVLCLGIPAGVKMHSGVFGVTPAACVKVIEGLLQGRLTGVEEEAEVRDIDEEKFRQGVVQSRYFGTMRVPMEHSFIQAVKVGGREDESLVICDIAAYLQEQDWFESHLIIFGSGGTLHSLSSEFGLATTLLGIDAAYQGEVIASDIDEKELFSLVSRYAKVKLLVSIIGGQGYILGRGNQQISARVIETVGVENIVVISSRNKLKALDQRPLLVDTGSPRVDASLAGIRTVLTGYDDFVLYPVAGERG